MRFTAEEIKIVRESLEYSIDRLRAYPLDQQHELREFKIRTMQDISRKATSVLRELKREEKACR